MKLSHVFGISPEFAARLADAHVHTLQDLANTADLKVLSARSQVSVELLEHWRIAARSKVVVVRRRRKAVAVLVAVTVILIGTIAAWSYKNDRRDKAVGHYNLGNDRRDEGDQDGAIAEYRKALALNPDFAAAHNNLGITLADKGDYTGAIAEYRKALVRYPDYAHSNICNALNNEGDYDGAIVECRAALVANPDN